MLLISVTVTVATGVLLRLSYCVFFSRFVLVFVIIRSKNSPLKLFNRILKGVMWQTQTMTNLKKMRYHTAFSHATYIHFSVFFVPCVTTVFCILWARQASDTSLRHKQHEFTLFVEQFVLFVACINAVLQTSYYYRSILVGLVVCGLLYKVYIPYILCGSIYPL